jgi:hypothetical protein
MKDHVIVVVGDGADTPRRHHRAPAATCIPPRAGNDRGELWSRDLAAVCRIECTVHGAEHERGAASRARAVLSFCNARQLTAPEAYITFTPELFPGNGEVADEATVTFLTDYHPACGGRCLGVLGVARDVAAQRHLSPKVRHRDTGRVDQRVEDQLVLDGRLHVLRLRHRKYSLCCGN